MSTPEHLFITPWFNADEGWSALKVNCAGDALPCWSSLIRLFDHPAATTIDRNLLWFIPISVEQSGELIPPLPVSRTVLLLTQPEQAGDMLAIEQIREEQHHNGRKLGLIVHPGLPLPATGTWDYIVFSVSHARTLPAFTLPGLSSRTRIAITGVRTRADHDWVNASGCAYSSGEYLFARLGPTNKPDMARAHLLKLLALVVEDADTREIEEIFRQEPKLSYSLLRLVNSAAMSPRSPITSFAQAINILGRRQLQRWLQLLVYADPNRGQHPNPLLIQSAARGRLMELLAPKSVLASTLDTLPDVAFMTGAFSLLDVLLNMSMDDILLQLPLPEAMSSALAEHTGLLGRLLEALSAADQQDFTRASRILGELGIDCPTYLDAQLSALDWASKIQI